MTCPSPKEKVQSRLDLAKQNLEFIQRTEEKIKEQLVLLEARKHAFVGAIEQLQQVLDEDLFEAQPSEEGEPAND